MKARSQLDVRLEVANRLKAAREKAGYSTAEAFCEQCDIPLSIYKKHEESRSAMVASEILQYCAALNVSIYYLMLGEELEQLTDPAVRKRKPQKPFTPKELAAMEKREARRKEKMRKLSINQVVSSSKNGSSQLPRN